MSDQPSFKRASRQGVKPLIGIYGESGNGKTYSALLLARGIAGPNGKIGMIDTESGRGSLYADVLPGGYEVLELSAPFSPQRYIDSIHTAEKAGLDILVIDSASHEWEGIGGVLDQAGEKEEKSGKPGLHCWKEPKMNHQKMMLCLLQSRLPIIVCLRAKFKSRQAKNQHTGKNEIVKDDYVTPIQAEDFIFELTAHCEIQPNHSIRLTKCSHPALRDCFPEDFKGPITIKHGELIADWAKGGKASGPQVNPDVKALKKRLTERAKGHYANAAGGLDVERFTREMKEAKILLPDEELSTLSFDRLKEFTEAVEDKLEAVF